MSPEAVHTQNYSTSHQQGAAASRPKWLPGSDFTAVPERTVRTITRYTRSRPTRSTRPRPGSLIVRVRSGARRALGGGSLAQLCAKRQHRAGSSPILSQGFPEVLLRTKGTAEMHEGNERPNARTSGRPKGSSAAGSSPRVSSSPCTERKVEAARVELQAANTRR